MIDFDKSEFLARLDVRFAAFSALLEMHEKYIISLCESNKTFIDATKAVERHHKEMVKFINETDKKIYDFFEKAKSEVDKQPTADVVEVRHGEWEIRGLRNPKCSLCNQYGYAKDRYCPNCGAKMGGERREE